MKRRAVLGGMFAAGALVLGTALAPIPAAAQEVTLRVHHFLPPQATVPKNFIAPWAEKVQADSGGRITVELYPAMQLGGAPPALIDQVRDGVVDIVWTLPGYTPGRFPKAEAFELPFMPTTGEATSRAFHEYFENNLQDEFADFHIIAAHVHGPGLLHMKGEPVRGLDDLSGKKLRGPTRVITQMLGQLGAVPVGMPVPQVPESLSKGVIDGTVIPWEVTVPLKVAELVDSHTGFTGDHGLYTAVFVFAMNKDSYNNLPDDLKAVIDQNSGIDVAGMVGKVMDDGDAPGMKIAQDRGNTIVMLDEAETGRWQAAAEPVIAAWIEEMKGKGIDGQALVDEARALIAKHSQ